MEERFSKRKRQRSAVLSIAREDTISKLPDALISQMLSYLPTKEAVRTSVLSKRWKMPLWLLISGLDLASSDFPDYNAFVGFMEKFIGFSMEEKSCLHKLKLSIREDNNDQACVTRWIDFAATPKLTHLDYECLVKRECLHSMPVSLYICESLFYLRLHRVFLGGLESVSLPRLKTMRLEYNVYANEACLESLISSSPLLEDLSIIRKVDDDVKVLRVRSQTLNTLSVSFDIGGELSGFDRGLLIDAPRLKYLKLYDEVSKSKIFGNLDCLAKVVFAGFFDIQYHSDGAGLSKNKLARDFFIGISRVRDMIISENAVKSFIFYSRVEPLPQFCNLYCLEAQFSEHTLSILPRLLACCPNLKSIVLDLAPSPMLWMHPIRLLAKPQCLLSSLESVEIKSRFVGTCVEREVGRYFVENSVLLKKLVVHLSCSMEQQGLGVLRDLQALSKPSRVCQIVYVADAD